MTRGALTTFSIANDVAKYFAILPAMFVTAYPEMQALNIMRLATPQSAVLSAVIFNALIIVALIPLALRGVAYRPRGANAVCATTCLSTASGASLHRLSVLRSSTSPFPRYTSRRRSKRDMKSSSLTINSPAPSTVTVEYVKDGTLRHLVTAAIFAMVSVVVLGIIYPLVMTGIGMAIFPNQANGSLVRVGGKIVGSDIIGQLWTKPQYFWGRPSAAGKNGYDPTATGGTNLGPTSKKLIGATRDAIDALRKANPDATLPIPMDLVTSSGSGIDPDISPEAAFYQVPRVAKARNMSVDAIHAVITKCVHGRGLGFLGEPHVNVLELNLALDGKR